MKVSVIIPVYNAERFLEEAVDSALAQPETAEVVLVEDGSSDDSLAVCQRLADKHPKVGLLRHPDGKNRAAAASLNLGIEHARCDLIAFLDADDYYLPNRFREARKLFESSPDIEGVYEAVRNVHEDESVKEWFDSEGRKDTIALTKYVDPDRLLHTLIRGDKGHFQINGLTVQRKLLERVGKFDASLYGVYDSALAIKMAALGRLVPGSISEPVAMRRLHGANTVYVHRDRYHVYKIEMWRTLIPWAIAHNLEREHFVLLLDGFVKCWFKHVLAKRHMGRFARAFHSAVFLSHTLFKYPVLLRSRYYRTRVARTCGWERLRNSLRRLFKTLVGQQR